MVGVVQCCVVLVVALVVSVIVAVIMIIRVVIVGDVFIEGVNSLCWDG